MRKSLRTKKRIERDLQSKHEKLLRGQEIYNYSNVFRYCHFIDKLPSCMKDVGWKASVQKYFITSITKMFNDYIFLQKRKLPSPVSDKEIVIYERGKARKITPIHIKDRMIQKVLCDEALVPLLSQKLIYDNGASLEGKGVMFSRERMLMHLKQAIKEYGNDFYVLSFDFKSFFDSVPHKTCRYMLEKYFADEEIVEITMEIIKLPHRVLISKIKDKEEKARKLAKLENEEYCGICLGSQVSQIMALIVGNDLDHYIKDQRGIKHYVRYMDDGIIFGKTKEELQDLYEGMKVVCDRLGLNFNVKKTYITKIRKGFTFLKVKYFVTGTGKIIRKLTRQGITRMRRKLKRFRHKVDDRTMTLDNVYDSMQSWLAHAKVAHSYKTVKSMLALYNELFDGYKITKKWKHVKEGNNDVLQADKRP